MHMDPDPQYHYVYFRLYKALQKAGEVALVGGAYSDGTPRDFLEKWIRDHSIDPGSYVVISNSGTPYVFTLKESMSPIYIADNNA